MSVDPDGGLHDERTTLSWMRTAFAFFVAAALLGRLVGGDALQLVVVPGTLAACGGLIALRSARRRASAPWRVRAVWFLVGAASAPTALLMIAALVDELKG